MRVPRWVALLLVLAACSDAVGAGSSGTPAGGGKPGRKAAPPKAPLTGLALAASPSRAALAVKIENAKAARPQSGLQYADVVYEELVEGGLTRFIGIFHSQDAPTLGPVRSARMVDPDILVEYRALFAYSGGSTQVLRYVDRSGLVILSHTKAVRAYHRMRNRRAPHNLYTTTQDLYASAGGAATPPPQFFSYSETRPKPLPAPSASASPAAASASPSPYVPPGASVEIPFSGAQRSVFRYDAVSDRYLRFQGSGYGKRAKLEPHVMDDGAQIAPRNVLVMFVEVAVGSHRDAAGNYSPEITVVGTGRVMLFRNGILVPGRWSRGSLTARTKLVDSAGTVLRLAPGQTWVELVPVGTDVSAT